MIIVHITFDYTSKEHTTNIEDKGDLCALLMDSAALVRCFARLSAYITLFYAVGAVLNTK
jgi:hypothetical protein